MKLLKKIVVLFPVLCLMLTRTAWANEKVYSSTVLNHSEAYLQAFYAAFATLLTISLIWLIIFKPKFKDSDDSF